jgi:hypothetical protein
VCAACFKSEAGWPHVESRANYIGIRSRGVDAPRMGPGLRGLAILGPYAALVTGKGCQYLAISAAAITNTTHPLKPPTMSQTHDYCMRGN